MLEVVVSERVVGSEGESESERSSERSSESAAEWKWDDELDTRGLFCPEPVMLLHNRIADIQEGQVLKVMATDPSTTRDIPRFCQFLNHELLKTVEVRNTHQSADKSSGQGGEFIFFIRRGV
jgi:tRNA 2-thiouridine synthesizing protein A